MVKWKRKLSRTIYLFVPQRDDDISSSDISFKKINKNVQPIQKERQAKTNFYGVVG